MEQYDVIIIGAGTAGLSAAIYAARSGKRTLVLEGKSCGGQIINAKAVVNYPGIKQISGVDFAMGLYEQAVEAGAKVLFQKAVRIELADSKKIVATAKQNYACGAVILAMGAKNRPLGLEREVELTGSGVSYCATCDGAFYKGKKTAVVGGGNTALEDALVLSEYCQKVTLIHRRDSFRGEWQTVQELKERSNVEILTDTVVTALEGDRQLTGIRVRNLKQEKEWVLPVHGLFAAVGQTPQSELVRDLVELDDYGYIKADESCRTSLPGIFAAGDCRTKEIRQLATAAADGVTAALAACQLA